MKLLIRKIKVHLRLWHIALPLTFFIGLHAPQVLIAALIILVFIIFSQKFN
tara:strand:- start:195 stop:347 length:153 start_codon:yes stop_codon:yes gene_type:complete